MAFEMICGQCRGNLLVEQFGVVVACPHCGAHLHVPAPENPESATPAPQPAPSVPAEVPPPAFVSNEHLSAPAPPTTEMNAFTGDESEPPPSVEISVMSPVSISESASATTESVTEEAAAPDSNSFSLSALMSSSETAASEPPPPAVEPSVAPVESSATISEPSEASVVADPIKAPAAMTSIEATSTGLSGLFGSGAASTPPEQLEAIAASPAPEADLSDVAPAEGLLIGDSSPHEPPLAPASAGLAPPTVTKPSSNDHVTISKSVFLILLSYVSAITIGFVYLLYFGSAKSSDYGLESLPDVVPKKKKTSGISIYKETAPMPDGHDLQVGDSQRFGNIEVSVLKVTRGPIKFEHFSDAKKFRFPSAPVLKLWLRFKNVSEDQEIAPLDDQLLFARAGKNRLDYRSNQFVCRAEQKANPHAKRIIAFDHIIGSGWDLAGLPLEKSLQPGESRDYYVPTCENDLEVLTGELLWRVHIRKGYSSRGNGVTTLFEVRFNSQLIRDEAA